MSEQIYCDDCKKHKICPCLGPEWVGCAGFEPMDAARGKKDDGGKLDWSSLDLSLIEPLVKATEYGKKKYGEFNYLRKFDDPQRLFSALMRHTAEAQHEPMAIDSESGCYHLASVAFNALVLLRQVKDYGAK